MNSRKRLHIAVIGSGAAGLSAVWLLAKQHQVTLIEQADRLGGHSNTVTTNDPDAPLIDTGFIVYNEPSYPNLTRWFEKMGVATEASNMSFAVSRDNGGFEYAGGPPLGLLAQPGNILRPRFYRMVKDLLRFYRNASSLVGKDRNASLGEFLEAGNYSREFLDDHLMPFAAAIWSAPPSTMLEYPAESFIRFCDNHGLLQILNRPQWRTVTNGSQSYVNKVADSLGRQNIKLGSAVQRVLRSTNGVDIKLANGESVQADHVVIASHGDQALAMLEAPSELEQSLLGAFQYEPNRAVLHTDKACMPKRKRAWCSWNYVEANSTVEAKAKQLEDKVSVSYWMNKLQNLKSSTDYFVTLNPVAEPRAGSIIMEANYDHPIFNVEAMDAQHKLWRLQGQQNTWFCGSYFGSGFHEDAIQSGMAVAEQLGQTSRPWNLDNPSSRITVAEPASIAASAATQS